MNISIENFKSIKKLNSFEIRPFNILSGVNSSGKSSFVQLLLLLKQTIDLDSSNKLFYLDGELYKVSKFRDLIYDHDFNNNLKIALEFSKAEFDKIDNLSTVPALNALGDFKCVIEIQYAFKEDKELISHFSISFNFGEDEPSRYISFDLNSDGDYLVDTKTGIFGHELINISKIKYIHYSSIYPLYCKSEDEKKTFVDIDDIKLIINSFFNNLSYIGPFREPPKDEYSVSRNLKNVDKTGSNIAQILENYADESIVFHEIEELKGVLKRKSVKKKLSQAVKYWMCDFFNIADDIKARKDGEIYKIVLINKSGLATSIKHVGFGISQLLPIVVEGLIMPNNGTLIVEQPEIHLHPKIQSLLFDFLYGLTLQGKTIIVETHSSHFITRMRRRIAEDETNKMDDQINLTFIENEIFRTIELDDFGTLDYYPEDFIEPSNEELKAIVHAQMNKRKMNKK